MVNMESISINLEILLKVALLLEPITISRIKNMVDLLLSKDILEIWETLWLTLFETLTCVLQIK